MSTPYLDGPAQAVANAATLPTVIPEESERANWQTMAGKAARMDTQTRPYPAALRRTVLVANQKGGVGKTSITVGAGAMVARPALV